MRTVYYVPTIHSFQEMSYAGEIILERNPEKGPALFAAGECIWALTVNRIEQLISAGRINLSKTLLFPEGLFTPMAGVPEDYIESYLQQPGRTTSYIRSLYVRGAQVIPSEEIMYYYQEADLYDEALRIAQSPHSKSVICRNISKALDDCTIRRDIFSSEIIASTLHMGQSAIVMRGACHPLAQILASIPVVPAMQLEYIITHAEVQNFLGNTLNASPIDIGINKVSP